MQNLTTQNLSAAEVLNFPPLFFIQFPEKEKFLQKSSRKL